MHTKAPRALLFALLAMSCTSCLTRATWKEWKSSWSEHQWPSRIRTAEVAGDRLSVTMDYPTGLHRLTYELTQTEDATRTRSGPTKIPDPTQGALPLCNELDLGDHSVRLVNDHEVYESRTRVVPERWPVLVVQDRHDTTWRCQLPPVTDHNGLGRPLVIALMPFALAADIATSPIQSPFFVYAQFAGTHH